MEEAFPSPLPLRDSKGQQFFTNQSYRPWTIIILIKLVRSCSCSTKMRLSSPCVTFWCSDWLFERTKTPIIWILLPTPRLRTLLLSTQWQLNTCFSTRSPSSWESSARLNTDGRFLTSPTLVLDWNLALSYLCFPFYQSRLYLHDFLIVTLRVLAKKSDLFVLGSIR